VVLAAEVWTPVDNGRCAGELGLLEHALRGFSETSGEVSTRSTARSAGRTSAPPDDSSFVAAIKGEMMTGSHSVKEFHQDCALHNP
jgi:hypothetical protein